ncbi:hypothetical protein K4K60_011729 [Colletotrichum sp. SAR11_57]|nr:hypothetical protein K4K60_011729 [Colletotrichum sp. SAR11_57]
MEPTMSIQNSSFSCTGIALKVYEACLDGPQAVLEQQAIDPRAVRQVVVDQTDQVSKVSKDYGKSDIGEHFDQTYLDAAESKSPHKLAIIASVKMTWKMASFSCEFFWDRDLLSREMVRRK